MTNVPEISGIHHVTLSVSDLERSIAWYSDVLGAAVARRWAADGIDKALVKVGPVTITLVNHGDYAVRGQFSERRCGLDHLSFAVADRVTLDAWLARLDELGVTRGEISRGGTGDVLSFRDPDNIALEFYTLT